MTKKHLIALADALRASKPIESQHDPACYASCYSQWENDRDAIAKACDCLNPRFDRQRWLNYVAGRGQRKTHEAVQTDQ